MVTLCSATTLFPLSSSSSHLSPKQRKLIKRTLTVSSSSSHYSDTLLKGDCGGSVRDKLQGLSSEFRSLPSPLDRVKRLLHYASLLAPMEDSERVHENRVVGCATQVWVVAHMEPLPSRRMRFRADSDSEISKGFCSCLVWMLDGAEPEEVLMLQHHHLPPINLGFNLNANSRINTWHNLLLRMQNATKHSC